MASTEFKPAEPMPTPPPSSSASVPHPSTAQSLSKDPTPPTSRSGLDPQVSTEADATNADAPPFSPSSTTPVLEKDEPELDFTGNVDVNNDPPTEKDLQRVADLLVLDAQGQSRPFSHLYQGEGVAPRQLIIFVRHFFCGNCQEYLRSLSASITPESLLALPTPTFITVIGCGRPELIDMYVQTTSCPFPVYAEPTRKLYDLLGMTSTFDLGKKRPSYIQSNLFVTSVQSIVQGIKIPNKALKGGSLKQVGGEFLLEGGKCVWAHRMRNTRDHAEIEEIRQVLGLEVKRAPLRKKWTHGIKEIKEGRARSASWGRIRSKSRGGKGEKDSEGSKTPEGREEDIKKLNGRPTI